MKTKKTATVQDIYGKEYQVLPNSLIMSFSVYGIAVDGNKALILPSHDGYDWPGGTAKQGENHIKTLKREFKEETGLDVEPERIINVYTSLFHYEPTDENFHALLIFYLVNIVGGKISNRGFSENEKKYTKTARWEYINDIAKMRYVCNLDIGDELLKLIKSSKEAK